MSRIPDDANRRGNPKAVTWFGESWSSPLCDSGEHVKIPKGQRCFFCGHKFVEESRGMFMWHYPNRGHGVRTPVHLACVDHRVATLNPKHDTRTGQFVTSDVAARRAGGAR